METFSCSKDNDVSTKLEIFCSSGFGIIDEKKKKGDDRK